MLYPDGARTSLTQKYSFHCIRILCGNLHISKKYLCESECPPTVTIFSTYSQSLEMAIRGGGNIRRPDRDSTAAWHFDVSTVTRYAHFQATEAGAHRLHRPLRVPAARIQGGKGTAMKITLYYEDKFHPTILEVPDDECTVMVENDYRQRLDAAEDKSAVCRRSPQEIMDAELNAPTFKRNRTETRRHTHLSGADIEARQTEVLSDVPTNMLGEDYADLYSAIKKLRPQQREMIRRVFWEGVSQADIARQDGVGESTVSDRMRRIYQRLKKYLPKRKNFF